MPDPSTLLVREIHALALAEASARARGDAAGQADARRRREALSVAYLAQGRTRDELEIALSRQSLLQQVAGTFRALGALLAVSALVWLGWRLFRAVRR